MHLLKIEIDRSALAEALKEGSLLVRLARLRFLAPDITLAIIEGRQPIERPTPVRISAAALAGVNGAAGED